MRAISTVIGSILILMIVIALGGTSYLYISGIFTGKISTAFEVIYASGDTVTIRNLGTDPITSFRSFTIDGDDAVFKAETQDPSLVGYWKFDEGTRTNFILRSEEFDNSIWSKGQLTVTPNAVTAPDGTTTADLLTPTAGATDAFMYQYFTPLSTGSHTFSVWLKSVTGSNVAVTIYIQRVSPVVNVASLGATITPEWQRFTLTFNPADTTPHLISFGLGYSWVAGENIYAWGAQMEEAPEAGTYTKTINSPAGGSATAIDSSNKGNTGTLLPSGSEPRWVAGKWGNALRFDGSNDYVDVTDSASLNPSNTITLEAWIKRKTMSSPGSMPIINKDGFSPNRDYGMWLNSGDGQNLLLEIMNGIDRVCSIQGTTVLSTDTWYHVAATHDGSNIRLFINGNQEASASCTQAIGNTGTPLRIGCRSGCGALNSFNGTIDEVKIYNRALSAQEIKSSYNIGSQINAGEAATIKIYNQLSKGTHTARICTSSMCTIAILTIN